MGCKMSLLSLLLVFFGITFTIAGPTPGIVFDSDYGSHSEVGYENSKIVLENVTNRFYHTAGNKFYVSRIPKSWQDATKSCEEFGLVLASITTQKEQLEIFKFLFVNDIVPEDDYSGLWLSGQQLDNGKFSWTSANKYIDCWGWLQGEPSHLDETERCVELKVLSHSVQLGWNNLMCQISRRFICQRKETYSKDNSFNQQEEREKETIEKLETDCYRSFTSTRKPIDLSNRSFIRIG